MKKKMTQEEAIARARQIYASVRHICRRCQYTEAEKICIEEDGQGLDCERASYAGEVVPILDKGEKNRER